MKKSYKIISILLAGSLLFSDCTTVSLAKGKRRYLREKDWPFCCMVAKDEYFYYGDDGEGYPLHSIYRTDFGLLGRNVKKVWASANLESVFVSTEKNEIREIDFSHRKKEGEICYLTSLVSRKREYIYSDSDGSCYFKNREGDVFYSGYSRCFSLWNHYSGEERERLDEECSKTEGKVVKHQKILSNVKKCWSGAGMFAYVQDNSLKITGCWTVEADVDCYERKRTAEIYFQGQGDSIREVVCTGRSFLSWSAPWCVFVLMKDGSVWGMGNNQCKMLDSEDQDFSDKFVKIMSGGVKKIRAGGERVAVIKDDNSLWMWGRGLESQDAPCSFTPVKVADGVKDVSIGMRGAYMLLLKTNHAAYGVGEGDWNYVFTKKHTKKWYAKPVKLMENVKKVYTFGEGRGSLVLTRNNELYWTGNASFNWSWYEWMDGKKWRLPRLERKNLVKNRRKILKMTDVR